MPWRLLRRNASALCRITLLRASFELTLRMQTYIFINDRDSGSRIHHVLALSGRYAKRQTRNTSRHVCQNHNVIYTWLQTAQRHQANGCCDVRKHYCTRLCISFFAIQCQRGTSSQKNSALGIRGQHKQSNSSTMLAEGKSIEIQEKR